MPPVDLDVLFSADPNEFVATRDHLVRELRAEGDKTRANEVKQLRRPPVPVWALNQIARADPASIRTLVGTAATARQVQVEVMNGADPSALRHALAERRDAIEHVIASATAIIEESGRSVATYERELADTLNAIVTDDEVAEQLQAGRLVNTPRRDDADVDIFAGLPEPTGPRRNRSGSDERVAAAAAKREREAAAQRLRDADKAHRDAIAARDRAQQALDNAQRIVEAAERNLASARAALEALNP